MSSIAERIRVVLVEPSHPGNIGGAARALKTMGLKHLYVVAPKRFPDPQADWRAAGALDVLDAAHVVEDLSAAIADCHWVVGTSTRNRKIPWPINDAKGVASTLVDKLSEARESLAAIVFGREDNGLSNTELRRCHLHLQIPADAEYPSLNLAMAVQVVCYEIFQEVAHATDPDTRAKQTDVADWDRAWATTEQVEHMLAHLEKVLSESGFLDANNPGQTLTRLRRLFARTRLDATEVQILRGIFKHLGAHGPSGGKSGPK